ncbi:MAG: patatin-like phospholipase family protein [Gemmatimonadaceae bacterium]
MITPKKRRIALVIGAGSVKCAAALGLWRVLRREGIELDLVVGCSGGSIYASFMALGYDVETCAEMTTALWRREVTMKRAWRSMIGAAMPKIFRFKGSFSMVDDGELLRGLTAAYGERTFADAKIPLYVVATDLANGHQVTLTKGRIRDAIRASVAIPYVWEPWQVDGKWLLDGCLSAPLPVDVAMKEGADLILAMGFESPYPRRIKSATRYAFQLNSIYTNNLLRANFAFHNLAHHAEIIPILPEFDGNVGLFDTHKFPHVIEQGERAMEEQLPYLRQLLGREA